MSLATDLAKVAHRTGLELTAALSLLLNSQPAGATFVVGADVGDDVNVAVQLTDADGADLTESATVFCYLSADAAGASAGNLPDGGVVIGTDGLIVVAHTAALVFTITSEADGTFDIDITDAGAQTNFLVIVMPNGKLAISTVITHAA